MSGLTEGWRVVKKSWGLIRNWGVNLNDILMLLRLRLKPREWPNSPVGPLVGTKGLFRPPREV